MKMNTKSIISPPNIKNFSCAKTVVMAAAESDIDILISLMNIDKKNGKKLYLSRIYNENNISIIGPFIGAAYAVMLLETLAANGAERIILLGWCGSVSENVKIGDIIIAEAAFIDEGCSHSYEIKEDIVYSDKNFFSFIKKTANSLKSDGINIHAGKIWTTDAIYRETAEKVEFYKAKKALAVDMETSALFAIGAFRRISVCSILTVSDELYDLKWKPGFSKKEFLKAREQSCSLIFKIKELPANTVY